MDARAERAVSAAVEHMLDRIAGAIAQDAQRLVPIDTGHLRSTIHTEPPEGRSVRIRASADYAGHVELGTSRMDAQPFLRPALLRRRSL